MRILAPIFLLICVLNSKAQEIAVFDLETGEPIFNVAIFNSEKTKSTITNFDGRADISMFSEK